jgi:hypothetical protein
MDKSAKLPSSENPKKSTTAERLATESSVHPETIVTDGQFAEGVQAPKEIREDLCLGGLPVTGQRILRDRCRSASAKYHGRGMGDSGPDLTVGYQATEDLPTPHGRTTISEVDLLAVEPHLGTPWRARPILWLNPLGLLSRERRHEMDERKRHDRNGQESHEC